MENSNNNLIFINGVLQDSEDCTVSADTITLTSNMSSGESVILNYDTSIFSTCSITSPSVSTISITGASPSSIILDEINNNSWTFIETVPFETGFPDSWDDFQNMCKEYPGLEKTFEHMKAFYKLCKDDWESKKRGDE